MFQIFLSDSPTTFIDHNGAHLVDVYVSPAGGGGTGCIYVRKISPLPRACLLSKTALNGFLAMHRSRALNGGVCAYSYIQFLPN